MEDMTQEQGMKVADGWRVWLDKTGSALVDVGLPMADGHSVVDNGTVGSPAELNGYTIIQAEDMAAALAIAEDHPFLSDKTGAFSVEVYELMPMPM
jgi:hypothetical protein